MDNRTKSFSRERDDDMKQTKGCIPLMNFRLGDSKDACEIAAAQVLCCNVCLRGDPSIKTSLLARQVLDWKRPAKYTVGPGFGQGKGSGTVNMRRTGMTKAKSWDLKLKPETKT